MTRIIYNLARSKFAFHCPFKEFVVKWKVVTSKGALAYGGGGEGVASSFYGRCNVVIALNENQRINKHHALFAARRIVAKRNVCAIALPQNIDISAIS